MIVKKTSKILSGLLISLSSATIYAQTPLTFEPLQTFETGGPMPQFSIPKDLNGDGHLDMLVSSEGKFHFLMGDGTGILTEMANINLSP